MQINKQWLFGLYMNEAADADAGGSGGTDEIESPDGSPNDIPDLPSGDTDSEPTPADEEPSDSEGDTDSDGDSDASDCADAESDIEYFFGEQQVQVEIPAEVKTAFEEAGVTEQEVLGQLFAKEGDFSLKEDTYDKLTTKFGKTMVDGYLNLYKQQNTSHLEDVAAKESAANAALLEQHNDFSDMVGGDEGWDSLSAWAGENLDAKELDSFNALMDLGSEHYTAQRAVISAIKGRMSAASGSELTLLGGNSSDSSPDVGKPEGKGYLTSAEYTQLMSSEGLFNWANVKSNPEAKARIAQLDSLRTAGIKGGH